MKRLNGEGLFLRGPSADWRVGEESRSAGLRYEAISGLAFDEGSASSVAEGSPQRTGLWGVRLVSGRGGGI